MLNELNIQYATDLALGCLSVTGEQAQQFLQGQISCDLSETLDDQVLLGLRFNVQGRVLAAFRIISWGDGYLMITARDNVMHLKQSLDKYAIFSKVTIKDVSDSIQITGVITEHKNGAPPATSKVTPLCKQQTGVYYYKLFDHHHFEVITDLQQSPTNGIDPEQNATQAHERWISDRLQACMPEITHNMSELWTAHAINLAQLNFVNFHKGCYLGQEIVARMEFRAHIKQSLYCIQCSSLNHLPEPGEKIVTSDDKTAGELVELHHLPTNNQTLGLATLKHNQAHEALTLADQAVTVL